MLSSILWKAGVKCLLSITFCSLLVVYCLMIFAYCQLLFANCLLLNANCYFLIVFCLLHFAICQLLFANRKLFFFSWYNLSFASMFVENQYRELLRTLHCYLWKNSCPFKRLDAQIKSAISKKQFTKSN